MEEVPTNPIQPQAPQQLPSDEDKTSSLIPKRYRIIYYAVLGTMLLLVITILILVLKQNSQPEPHANHTDSNQQSTSVPKLSTADVVSGFDHIWDVAFIDKDTMLFTERKGSIHAITLNGEQPREIANFDFVKSEGEGGLLGMTLDTNFATNHYAYVCYNENKTPLKVKVARIKINDVVTSVTEVTDIIPDIQSKGGRHSGCRMAMDKNEVLWVGTGDSAIGTAPQNPKSLAGKVLRVDRDGKAAGGNLPKPFDPRIYSYGHRNIQGLVLFDEPNSKGALGMTSEHGPDRQDEINWLLPGNFGWDPSSGTYDESVPMTDTKKFRRAIKAIWNSGKSTIAPSGLEILQSDKWQAWRGSAVMAVLKNKHVRLIDFDDNGKVIGEQEILKDFGRIRSVTEGPEGDLFISTDNGNTTDKIIRVSAN